MVSKSLKFAYRKPCFICLSLLSSYHFYLMFLGISISNNDFSHTAQTGLFVATSSNVIVDSNTFTDIGERLHVKFYLVNLLINI